MGLFTSRAECGQAPRTMSKVGVAGRVGKGYKSRPDKVRGVQTEFTCKMAILLTMLNEQFYDFPYSQE